MCLVKNAVQLINKEELDLIKSKCLAMEVDVTKVKTTSCTEKQEAPQLDFLAVSTQSTRKFFIFLSDQMEKAKSSTLYKIMTKTTQPTHVLIVLMTCFVLNIIWPTVIPDAAPQTTIIENVTKSSPQQHSKLALFGYLTAFAVRFGTQMWMTFVSGLALYFSLSRHIFGLCQKVLFPKYFALNAVLGVLMLTCFTQVLPQKQTTMDHIQLGMMALSAIIEAVIRLYLVQPLLILMHLKHKYEIAVGSGSEVGYENQKQLKASPKYQRVHKSFRRIHMTIAIGNIITVACTFAHLYYLVQKIQIN